MSIIALQVTLSLSVEEGEYLVVPSTFTANTEREFLVWVWADTRWSCSLAGPGIVTVETVRDYKVCTISEIIEKLSQTIQRCFVCCHYGGGFCSCCCLVLRRCQGGCCGGHQHQVSCCCDKEDQEDTEVYQKSEDSGNKTRIIKIQRV